MDNQNQRVHLDQPVQPAEQKPSISVRPFGIPKVLLPFFVVIIILIGVGSYSLGARQAQKQVAIPQVSVEQNPISDPTTNWKTYADAKTGIEFKYPQDLSLISVADDKLLAAFTDESNTRERLSALPDISFKTFIVNPGEDFRNKLIEDVIFDGSGLHPKSFSEFSSRKIGENAVYFIRTGLFEGVLSFNYYLINKDQIVVFNLVSNPVDWTNPAFNPENDSLNQKLLQILSTFKFAN